MSVVAGNVKQVKVSVKCLVQFVSRISNIFESCAHNIPVRTSIFVAVVRPYTFNKISPKRQHLVCTSPLKSLKVRSVVSFILCMNNQPVGLVFEGFDFRTDNSTSRQRANRPENKTQSLCLISLVFFQRSEAKRKNRSARVEAQQLEHNTYFRLIALRGSIASLNYLMWECP